MTFTPLSLDDFKVQHTEPYPDPDACEECEGHGEFIYGDGGGEGGRPTATGWTERKPTSTSGTER